MKHSGWTDWFWNNVIQITFFKSWLGTIAELEWSSDRNILRVVLEFFFPGFHMTFIFEKIMYNHKNILNNENVYNLITIKFIPIFAYNLLALDSMYVLFYVIG